VKKWKYRYRKLKLGWEDVKGAAEDRQRSSLHHLLCKKAAGIKMNKRITVF